MRLLLLLLLTACATQQYDSTFHCNTIADGTKEHLLCRRFTPAEERTRSSFEVCYSTHSSEPYVDLLCYDK